jgi:hypothetical protein
MFLSPYFVKDRSIVQSCRLIRGFCAAAIVSQPLH